MLKGNLATRPFYNERAVRIVLAVLAVFVLIITVVSVTRVVSLQKRGGALNADASRAEVRSTELRRATARLRGGVDAKELQAVSAAALEANGLVDRRTFSWTELFNRFEATQPPDVRITAVKPKVEKGSFTLSIALVARDVNDVDAFMENLERTGAFPGLLAREEHVIESGELEAAIESRYIASPPVAATVGAKPVRAAGARKGPAVR